MEYHLRPNALVEYAEAFSKSVCENFFAEDEEVEGKELVRFTAVPQVNAFLVKSVFEGWQQEASNIRSPLFDYSSDTVKDRMNALMKALSSNISIKREHMEPMLTQSVVDTFILAFNPKQYFRIMFGKLPNSFSPERDVKNKLKYVKLHPDFIRETYATIARKGSSVKKDWANDVLEAKAEDEELFIDPEIIVNQFHAVEPFIIRDLVSDWVEEFEAPLGLVTSVPDEEEDDAPEIDDSFSEKTEHYEEEDYLPEDEERAIYNEEDMNSEEEFIGEDERILTAEDYSGEEVPPEYPEEELAPSLDDDSIANLVDIQPSLELDVNLARTPNVERVGLPSHETIEEEVEETSRSIVDEEESISTVLDTLGGTIEEEEETTTTVLDNLTSSEPSDKEYAPLKGSIPLNMKFKFQNELFNGNNGLFNEAIEMIDQCKDYHAAIALIKERYIRPLEWDLGADATIDFLSLVDRKFE